MIRPGQKGFDVNIADPRAINFRNMTARFARQGRPIVRAELMFVRKLFQLDLDSFTRVVRDAAVALDDVAKKLAEATQRGSVVFTNGPGGTRSARLIDGNALLRDALLAVMKKNLTADQFALYQAESEKKSEFRKHAAVGYLVESLNQDLFLSENQRHDLTDALTAHWDESWSTTLDFILVGNKVYPIGADNEISPILNPAQRTLWKGSQRNNTASGGFGGSPPTNLINPQEELDELIHFLAEPHAGAVQPLEKAAARPMVAVPRANDPPR
jgi:hypothetical protein